MMTMMTMMVEFFARYIVCLSSSVVCIACIVKKPYIVGVGNGTVELRDDDFLHA